MRRIPFQPVLLGLILSFVLIATPKAEEDFTRWPVLVNPFESARSAACVATQPFP